MYFFDELARAEESGTEETERFLLAEYASGRAITEPTFRVTLCNELGRFYRAHARYEESYRFYSEGLEYAKAVYGTDSLQYGTILMNRAGTSRMAGDSDEAIRNFDAAIGIVSEHEECADVLGSAWNNLGLAYYAAGQREDAVQAMKKSLEIIDKTGDEYTIGTGHLNLASVFLELGRNAEALEHAERGGRYFCTEPDSPSRQYAEKLTAACRAAMKVQPKEETDG